MVGPWTTDGDTVGRLGGLKCAVDFHVLISFVPLCMIIGVTSELMAPCRALRWVFHGLLVLDQSLGGPSCSELMHCAVNDFV